jgi:hypothetical protein
MSVLNFCLAYMQLLEHTNYVVQYSDFKGKKDRDRFSTSGDRILPETGLHFDLFTSFPLPVN